MTEIQSDADISENAIIEMPDSKPRHIVFEAKSGVYFGKGQTL